MAKRMVKRGTTAAKATVNAAVEATRAIQEPAETVEVPANQVMLDEKTSLADVNPELAGETITVELPDLSDPAAAAEQAEMKREYEAEQAATAEMAEEATPPAKARETADTSEKDAEIAELRAMVQNLQKQMVDQNGKAQIVQVMADTEKVTLRFQSECADDNLILFGPNGMYGQITGKSGTMIVPKSDWSRFMTEQVRFLLDTRQLIILSGMDEDEMEMYGCNYREGELLDRNAFAKLLDMGDGLLEIFPGLCRSHKEMIAKRFLTAYENGDVRAQNRELIVQLNQLSKQSSADYAASDPRSRGLFTAIIEEMNAQDAE